MSNVDATTRDLEREIEAARIVREQITTLCGEDPDFIRDGIEGQTSLFEMMAAMVAADQEDKALIEGISAHQKAITARKDRVEKRIEVRRALMASALEISGKPSFEAPAGTISQKAVPPKLIVTDEAAIPWRCFKSPAPVLDKKALTDALKARAKALAESAGDADAIGAVEIKHPEIPGATLSNGGTTIQVRV